MGSSYSWRSVRTPGFVRGAGSAGRGSDLAARSNRFCRAVHDQTARTSRTAPPQRSLAPGSSPAGARCPTAGPSARTAETRTRRRPAGSQSESLTEPHCQCRCVHSFFARHDGGESVAHLPGGVRLHVIVSSGCQVQPHVRLNAVSAECLGPETSFRERAATKSLSALRLV